MFTVSLPRNYRNQQLADFGRIESLPGVYMANQLSRSVVEDPSTVHYDKNYNQFQQSKARTNSAHLRFDGMCTMKSINGQFRYTKARTHLGH